MSQPQTSLATEGGLKGKMSPLRPPTCKEQLFLKKIVTFFAFLFVNSPAIELRVLGSTDPFKYSHVPPLKQKTPCLKCRYSLEE